MSSVTRRKYEGAKTKGKNREIEKEKTDEEEGVKEKGKPLGRQLAGTERETRRRDKKKMDWSERGKEEVRSE